MGNMTDNLNGLVGNVKQASIQLNSTATELSATSRQQESTVRSFGSSANQIAAATKQISATNSELLGTMERVNHVALGTAELATAGRSSLQGMEDSMRDLDKATGSIGAKLAVINEKASNITGVVTTITRVADQTNLLSVNAAIEAEKAGEYGVGFLVVAREIRRLADQTSSATLDIEQMVQQMQSAVSAGVMEMDRFTDHVRRNVKDVATISQQMADIIEQVNSNTIQFESVNESMQSQAQGADQISQAMAQLTTNAAQTSEAIGEYARAADDLQQAINSLKSSVASFQLRS
jgi:methyl-accepting chemotaxis protein WspA